MDDDVAQDTQVMTVVERFATIGDANRAAASLVENGVGAVLDHDSPPQIGVAVLAGDVARARQVLGLEAVEELPDEAELTHMSRSWLIPVLLVGVATILVPLVAFYVTFKLSGG